MHQEVIKKIRILRKQKGFDYQDMADRLNIDLSTYKRLEAGKTVTWAKYLEDILIALETTVEDFFQDIGRNINVVNKKGSFGGNIHVENLFAENREQTLKIEQLYKDMINDKDKMNESKDEIIKELKEIIELKNQLIKAMK
ncbi:hypothetical protein GCM10011508_13230 [Flavobacterium lutivivi]|nr:hypothetical protein GCM10011508_13230 [Flavobacterium lutivivi]